MKKITLVFSILFTLFALVGCGTTSVTTATSQTTNSTVTIDDSKEITVYTRDTTSGTREAFFKGIDFDDAAGNNTVLVDGCVEVDGNGSMITSISNDKYGIGYISLASLTDSGLNGLNFEGVVASKENVINGTYGLQRPFNYIVRSDWTGMETERQISEAFIAYMSTIDGFATIMNKHGIVELNGNIALWDDIKAEYSICIQDNSSVTISFGGSTSVESIARALSAEFSAKCGDFIAEHNHTGSGDAYIRTQGTESEGANKLHIGFASREFKPSEPYSEGTSGLICLDAVVVVLNGNNSTITNITSEKLRKIYSGEYTTWSDLLG